MQGVQTEKDTAAVNPPRIGASRRQSAPSGAGARDPSPRPSMPGDWTPGRERPMRDTVEDCRTAARSFDPGRSDPGLPETAPGQVKADGRVLERHVSRFLVDLSIALHRFSMYPVGHPALGIIVDTLARRAGALLQSRQRIAIGVARDRLVIEGVVTDAAHPLLRGLAERLHRHHLSALTIYRGLTVDELFDLITTVASAPERDGPLGGRLAGLEGSWPHVGLYPLTVGALEMVDADGAEGGPGSSRCAGLWVGLAQAALGREVEPESAPPSEPAAVARAIDEHQPAEAYDQVIVGYLQQIAEEIRTTDAPETGELRRRVSTLVSTMHPATLRRLLAMGGSAAHRCLFVRTAAAGLSAGAVVDLVKAAAEASHEELSTGLVRLLTKLADHADTGTAHVQPLADSALRVQVARLLSDWDLPNPNPDDYSKVLERIAHRPATEHPVRPATRPAGDHLRLIEIALEVDTEGPVLWQAVDGLIESGQLAAAVALVRPAAAAGGLGARVWEALSSPGTVQRLLRRVPPDFAAVDALLADLPVESLVPLFDVLSDSSDRRDRRAAFDRLRVCGRKAAHAAMARLDDTRWYVVRNMLALLAEIDDLPPTCDPERWLGHRDARVRREALRVALRLSAVRPHAVSAALSDPDTRVVRLALQAASKFPCPPAAKRLLDLARSDLKDDELQAEALQALVLASRGRAVRDVLLDAAAREARRRRWSAREVTSRAELAALTALATYWPRDPLALPVLRRAAISADQVPRAAKGVPR
jgi:hypothetical protein